MQRHSIEGGRIVMKIVHIYAQNLRIWEQLTKESQCLVNAHVQFDDLIETLPQYNTRDVLGVVLFPKILNTSVFRYLKQLDNAFYFVKKPVVLIGDNVSKFLETANSSHKTYKNLILYIHNSEGGTISDTDIHDIMTLLLAEHGGVYNIPKNRFQRKPVKVSSLLKDANSDASFVLDLMLGDDEQHAIRNAISTQTTKEKGDSSG